MKNKLSNFWHKTEALKITLVLGMILLGIASINDTQKNKYFEKKEKYKLLKQAFTDLQEEDNYVELRKSEEYIEAKSKKRKIDKLFIAFNKTGSESNNFASRTNILHLLNKKINYLDLAIEGIKQ